jgi:hypothetical protein
MVASLDAANLRLSNLWVQYPTVYSLTISWSFKPLLIETYSLRLVAYSWSKAP